MTLSKPYLLKWYSYKKISYITFWLALFYGMKNLSQLACINRDLVSKGQKHGIATTLYPRQQTNQCYNYLWGFGVPTSRERLSNFLYFFAMHLSNMFIDFEQETPFSNQSYKTKLYVLQKWKRFKLHIRSESSSLVVFCLFLCKSIKLETMVPSYHVYEYLWDLFKSVIQLYILFLLHPFPPNLLPDMH